MHKDEPYKKLYDTEKSVNIIEYANYPIVIMNELYLQTLFFSLGELHLRKEFADSRVYWWFL